MKIIVEDKLIDILKLRRKQLNLTQEELAVKLGLSTMGLSYLESGSRGLKLELLNLWAKELGLEVEISVKELV
jgi:transcriptional regulator with XRE-family HTH domain